MQMIRVHNQQYCAGLYWQPLADGEKPAKKAAELAEKLRSLDHYEAYTSYERDDQRAVALLGGGEQPACPSLAAEVANALDEPNGSVIALLQIQGVYWIYAQSQGLIHPDGDQIHRNPEHAEQAFDQLLTSAEWDDVLRLDVGESEDWLQRLLPETPTTRPISPLGKQTGKRLGIAAAVLLIVAALVTVYLYREYRQTAQEAERQRALAALRAKQAKQADRAGIQAWMKAPAPSALLAACQSEFSKVALVADGWLLSQWSCGPQDTIQHRAKTSAASFEVLPGDARSLNFSDPRKIQYSVPMPDLGKRGEQSLWIRQKAGSRLLEYSDLHGFELQIGWPALAMATAERKRSTYHSAKFTISLGANRPWQTAKALDDIPGLILKQISWTPARGAWQINGEIYYAAK